MEALRRMNTLMMVLWKALGMTTSRNTKTRNLN
jgi:hypothetical protein